MKSNVKAIWSSDIEDLETLSPALGSEAQAKVDRWRFYVCLQVEVGPEEGPWGEDYGAETFQVLISSPDQSYKRHHFVFDNWDWPRIEAEIRRQFTVEGKDWQDIARKLNERGDWEFDNYQESPT